MANNNRIVPFPQIPIKKSHKKVIIIVAVVVIIGIGGYFFLSNFNVLVGKDPCKGISDQSKRESCYTNLALNNLNISLCDPIETKETYTNCVQNFVSIALQNKTTSICFTNDICYTAATRISENESNVNQVCDDFRKSRIASLINEAPKNEDLVKYCSSSSTEFCQEFNRYQVPPIEQIERCTI